MFELKMAEGYGKHYSVVLENQKVGLTLVLDQILISLEQIISLMEVSHHL